MPKISEQVVGQGTDTARVERLRELLTHYYCDAEKISRHVYLDDENRLRLMKTVNRVLIDRISVVLAEDWDGK